MNCILYITTRKPVEEFSKQLSSYLGRNHSVSSIYLQTSLSTNTNLLPQYFYGNANHTILYLVAKEDGYKIRLFIEGVNKRDNIDQLITGVKQLFQSIKSFLNSNKIGFKQISATIWSEDEEMLRGEYQSFWTKFKSNIPELPTGIYLTVITILYSIFQHKEVRSGDDSPSQFETNVKIAVINLLLTTAAIILWLLIKAIKRESNLSFKLK